MSKLIRIVTLLMVTVILICVMSPITVGASEMVDVTCLIDENDQSRILVTVDVPGTLKADDGKLYLFALPTYVDDLKGQSPTITMNHTGAGSYQFAVDLNLNTEGSMLYSKFVVATKKNGTFIPINGGNFITNPEVLAKSNVARAVTSSKKGVHADFFVPTDMEDIGIEHTYFGIYYQDILSISPTECEFVYNGKTYYFIPERMGEYDTLISNMTRAGMSVSVGLLNTYRNGYEHMLHPGITVNGTAENFALNTSTKEGLETAAAVHYFLAERYNGTDLTHGRVDNWIFGNEVNDGLHYYYMGPQNIEAFVAEYLQSFRVAYTAIKSAYSNANVYICLQNYWGTADSLNDYGGKHFVDLFGQYARQQGDIDWGLAYHPYSFPANDPDILNDSMPSVDHLGNPTFGVEVTDSLDTPVITMKNLHLLTQYFHTPELLNDKGEVRSIILSEQGYTSYSNITGKNEAKQAASIALAYYIAQMNPDVDAFILRGHTDADEVTQYYKFGLRNQLSATQPGSEKFSHGVYKYLNTKDSLEYSHFAKAALNIKDWSDVVRGWDEKQFSTMGEWTDSALYSITDAQENRMITKGMMDEWESGYNVFGIANFDGKAYWPDGFAVTNSFANYLAWQGIEKHFDNLNLSSSDYLTMDFRVDPRDSSEIGDSIELKIRLHSGKHVFDAIGIVKVGQQYQICADISQWPYRNAIDNLEIQIRSHGRKASFGGFLFAYNVSGSSVVSNITALEELQKEKTDLSEATMLYQKSFVHQGMAIEPQVVVRLGDQELLQRQDYDVIYHDNVNAGTAKIVVVGIGDYTGWIEGEFTIQGDYPTIYNGVDYALVYSYGYYKENYPQVVAEVGDDPEALLEHFVTKGMRYALQGSGDFNVLAYSQFNGDLWRAYGEDWEKYYIYHLEYGWKEGRPTSGKKPDNMDPPPYPNCNSGHTFDDGVDGICNVCGIDRVNTVNRKVVHMFRMYNPNTGEHFYTGSEVERDNLIAVGWQYEGVGFTFPANTGDPVHRLFHEPTGEHLYTMDEAEKERLMAEGWNYEGIAFNSAYDTEAVQHRLYNPNTTVGAYHFTFSIEERDVLISAGWWYQGIGWYSCWK